MSHGGYDYDVGTFSPQGIVYQLNYALEPPKLASPALGLCGKNHVVLIALCPKDGALSSAQQKLYDIDKKIGVAMCGLYPDNRKLIKILRERCTDYRYTFGTDASHPLKKLILDVSNDEMQYRTQYSGYRPFGTSTLFAGSDLNPQTRDIEPRLYCLLPTGDFDRYRAVTIGSRSQSISTHLRAEIENIKNAEDVKTLVHIALNSLFVSSHETRPTVENLSIAVVDVTKNAEFEILEKEAVSEYVTEFLQEHPDIHEDEDSDDFLE